MAWNTLQELKDEMKVQGFLHKAILSDVDASRLEKLLLAEPGVVDTPPGDLRYMEGLLDLPLGFVTEFKVIPAPEFKQCKCGRTPSALDIVSYACRRNVHAKTVVRDAVTGYQNIYEISQGGREADCLSCGRRLVMRGYFKKSYMYA